jgi:putative spermidine/putrescine transport system permease protein
VVLGYPVAFVLATAGRRVGAVVLACVLLPLWTNVLVRTYGWMVLLGRRGIVNEGLAALGVVDVPIPFLYNRLGVLIGMVHVLLPFMVLPMYGVMRGIDVELVKAAQNLGANVRQAFLRIYLPLSLPGVLAGSLLVFLMAIGFFVTPALLGGARRRDDRTAHREPGQRGVGLGVRVGPGGDALGGNEPDCAPLAAMAWA